MEDQEFDPEKAAKGISDFFSLSDIKDCDQSQGLFFLCVIKLYCCPFSVMNVYKLNFVEKMYSSCRLHYRSLNIATL